MLERLFKLSKNKTTIKTEVMAGITTFMTMAYILAVNPSILGDAGMDSSAVLLATAIASFIGTCCMAFMANLPFVLSAGMGLNAYLAYTVVLGFGYSWQIALLAVFVEGIIFVVLSLTNVREAIFNAGGFQCGRTLFTDGNEPHQPVQQNKVAYQPALECTHSRCPNETCRRNAAVRQIQHHRGVRSVGIQRIEILP